MKQTTSELTTDLSRIGAQLSQAIRADHKRHLRRRSLLRTSLIVTASVSALSGTALAAGELTGTIDLGGGHSAVPVTRTPAQPDPNLPYRYGLTGVHEHNRDGRGPIYIESSRPLSSFTQHQLAAARHACASKAITTDGAIVWVFSAGCAPAQP